MPSSSIVSPVNAVTAIGTSCSDSSRLVAVTTTSSIICCALAVALIAPADRAQITASLILLLLYMYSPDLLSRPACQTRPGEASSFDGLRGLLPHAVTV